MITARSKSDMLASHQTKYTFTKKNKNHNPIYEFRIAKSKHVKLPYLGKCTQVPHPTQNHPKCEF